MFRRWWKTKQVVADQQVVYVILATDGSEVQYPHIRRVGSWWMPLFLDGEWASAAVQLFNFYFKADNSGFRASWKGMLMSELREITTDISGGDQKDMAGYIVVDHIKGVDCQTGVQVAGEVISWKFDRCKRTK